MKDLEQLFRNPLPSGRSGAFFNTFSYPTKISPESIAVYIATVTKPGDTVLDIFSGSGSTGIAALLCECPTPKMKEIASELGVNPVWGMRHAVGYEIGTYGAFAAKTIANRLKADEFKAAADSFVKRASDELGYYYEAKAPDDQNGSIRYVIWTEILKCPECGGEISYFESATKRNPVKFEKEIKCPHCKKEVSVEKMDFITERYYDKLLQKECKCKKRIPAWIYGCNSDGNWERKVNGSDIALLRKIESEDTIEGDAPKPIFWGDLHRSGYHYGIDYLHQFYTKRNYSVMKKLWALTEEYDETLENALKLLLLSYNSSHCTLMTRVVAKQNAKDFVLTGAQSGVLYISRLPVEKNILLGLQRKSKAFYDAYKLLEHCKGSFVVKNSSCEMMDEKDKSIDFVFTDPPFGDFIPYAEVNQINELWLDHVTERKSEMIISGAENKSIMEYEKMMTKAFSEVARVLKDRAYAAVVFHAAKAQIWSAFENVIKNSGLDVKLTNILDKKQASFKQIVSASSVQRDPLLLLQKEKSSCIRNGNEAEILENIVLDMNAQSDFDERRAYSLYVNECLKNNIRVSLDAKDAYSLMRRYRKETVNGSV